MLGIVLDIENLVVNKIYKIFVDVSLDGVLSFRVKEIIEFGV